MIYRSIFSFNLSTLSRTWSPTSVRNLSISWQTIGTETRASNLYLSLSNSFLILVLTMVLRGLVSRISPLLKRGSRWENEAVPQESNEFQKPTYSIKMFFFRLRIPSPSSSAKQSSITELLHFPNLSPLSLSLSLFSRYTEMKLDFRGVWPLL